MPGWKTILFLEHENAMVIITTITAKKFSFFIPPLRKNIRGKKKSSRFRGGWVYFPKLHQTPAFCCNVTYTFREGGFNRSTHWTTFWTKFKLLPLQCTVVNISAFPLKVPFPCTPPSLALVFSCTASIPLLKEQQRALNNQSSIKVLFRLTAPRNPCTPHTLSMHCFSD